MGRVHLVDLEHDGIPGAIGVYVLEGPEPTIVDPGPATTLPALRRGLAELGSSVAGIRHVLLTHIHLDHAGATGYLVAENPGLQVHVHADGAPHMSDPRRLVASTRRSFGQAHDRLWGEVFPVPDANLRPWRPATRSPLHGIRPVHTPGHIAHHVAYLHEDSGTLFAGDCLGIILGPGAPTHPPTPAPSLDLRAWERTLEELADYDPDRFGVTHFGLHDRFHERRRELADGLATLAERVARALEEGDDDATERYQAEVVGRLGPSLPEGRAERYFGTFPASNDWAGVRFYLERHPGARTGRA